MKVVILLANVFLARRIALAWGCGAVMAIGGCTSNASPGEVPAAVSANVVRVVAVPGGFRLQKQGKPYRIRGAGGTEYYDRLREAGGNSVRLWSTDYAGPLLNEAHRQGLTVHLGLWLEPQGGKIDYYDPTAVQEQLHRLRRQVLRYRNHPALLMWSVGNELDLSRLNPKIFVAINEVAVMIHGLDPNHPVTTAMANLAMIPTLQRWAPAIDILSINTYGGLLTVARTVRQCGWTGPYIVSEFGARGFWESENTPWEAALEQSSGAKAAYVAQRYRRTVVADSARCLGSYVFFWGTKWEATPTWFSLFSAEGEKTLLVDTLQYLWQGKQPKNHAPSILRLELDGRRDVNFPRLRPGVNYVARYVSSDAEADELTAHWELWPEGKIRGEARAMQESEPLTGYLSPASRQQALLRAPRRAGAYRLFLWVRDGHGGVATANIPFYCDSIPQPAEIKLAKYLRGMVLMK